MHISILNLVPGTLDVVLDLVQDFALLLNKQRHVQQQLMKFRYARFKREHVLVSSIDIIINGPVPTFVGKSLV